MRFRNQRHAGLVAIVAACTILTAVTKADEPPAAPASEDQIARWIHELSSESFAARRAAGHQLTVQGLSSVPALVEAAGSADRETSQRCIDILSRLKESDDEATRAGAVEALAALSESRDAAVSERARGFVEEPVEVADIPAGAPLFRKRPVQLRLIQRGAVAFDVNGERHVETVDGDRRIEIREQRGGEIVVRTTRTGADGDQTTEVAAANATELGQTDPEAFLLYRRHLLQGGGPLILQAQPLGQGAVHQQVIVTEIDGERRIRVMEGERRIEIRDRAGTDIRVTVTREVNGEPQTSEYSAEGLEELRANHPEGAALYEKYAKGGEEQPRLPANGNVLPGPAPRGAFGGGTVASEISPAADRIEAALQTLTEIRTRLQQLKAREHADQNAVDDLVQKLDEAEQRLFEAESQLED